MPARGSPNRPAPGKPLDDKKGGAGWDRSRKKNGRARTNATPEIRKKDSPAGGSMFPADLPKEGPISWASG